VEIPRPEGFKVVEKIGEIPATEWRGREQGRYAFFLLEKVNRDHFSVLNELERVLGSKVRYLGIKDANAITYQLVYVKAPSKVTEYVGEGFKITLRGYYDGKVSHGGNEFTIRLVSDKLAEIEERVKEITKDPYVPNFIGYQRFGTRRPITHVVGYYLLRRDWCNALFHILGRPFYSESETMRKARKLVDEGRLEEALKELPGKFKQERVLLKNYLRKVDCYSALKSSLIPLSFYVEAFQSYLFNKYLSRKMDEVKRDKETYLTLPVEPSKCDDVCREVLQEEGICLAEFKVPELKVNLRELTRKAFVKVRNIRFQDGTLTFEIERGAYATIVLKELLNADPLKIT
jgi:tRNA pseudouridine13 synthase